MTKTKLIGIILGIIIPMLLAACGGGKDSGTDEQGTASPDSNANMPLNISVYLDLSDRLIRDNVLPSQMENDTALINSIFNIFLRKCQDSNLLTCKNHFQLFFYPAPPQPNINKLAKDLNLDLAAHDAASKRKALINFRDSYKDNIAQIYTNTLQNKSWVGSDIWGFFSNRRVDSYCIRKGYRNILIIISDGYIYDKNNVVKKGNAFSYILPQTIAIPGSSLIAERQGLEDLEVLLLEFNPMNASHRDPMNRILEDWFKAMGIQHLRINEADVAANTEAVISDFIR